jgi:hypothetical protein
MKKTKKLIIEWQNRKVCDDGSQSKKIVGMAHPGCCSQSGGCPKKHG